MAFNWKKILMTGLGIWLVITFVGPAIPDIFSFGVLSLGKLITASIAGLVGAATANLNF